jgi:hypothetical protein
MYRGRRCVYVCVTELLQPAGVGLALMYSVSLIAYMQRTIEQSTKLECLVSMRTLTFLLTNYRIFLVLLALACATYESRTNARHT